MQKTSATTIATSTSIVPQPKCAGGRAYAYMLSTKAPIAINVSPKEPAAIPIVKQTKSASAPKLIQAVQVKQAPQPVNC